VPTGYAPASASRAGARSQQPSRAAPSRADQPTSRAAGQARGAAQPKARRNQRRATAGAPKSQACERIRGKRRQTRHRAERPSESGPDATPGARPLQRARERAERPEERGVSGGRRALAQFAAPTARPEFSNRRCACLSMGAPAPDQPVLKSRSARARPRPSRNSRRCACLSMGAPAPLTPDSAPDWCLRLSHPPVMLEPCQQHPAPIRPHRSGWSMPRRPAAGHTAPATLRPASNEVPTIQVSTCPAVSS